MRLRAAALAACFLAGCATAAESESAGLRAAREAIAIEAEFARDADAIGIVPAFRKRVGPNAILFLPDPTVVNAMLETAKWPGDLNWRPEFVVASSAGDVVFTTGPSAWTVGDKTDLGWYFSIWTRQPDGRLAFVVDGNTPTTENLYAAPPSEPEVLLGAIGGRSTSDPAALEADLADDARADARRAIVARLDPRGRLMRAGARPAVGPEAAAALLAGRPAQLTSSKVMGSGTASSGDLHWSYGEARWTDAGVEKRGYWTRVWRRGPDGWRVVFDQMNERPAG